MPLTVLDHPLIQHKLSILRDKNTGSKDFRELVEEIAMLMAYEATRSITIEEVEIETPLQTTKAKVILGKKIGLIPILRAGLGMVDGILHLVPTARVGHIGIYRDHVTLEPVEYYCKLPEDLSDRDLLILDPMLATGGSAVFAVEYLVKQGSKPENIKYLCLLAAPEGIKKLQDAYPQLHIFTAAIDEKLNDKGYILPGLGDAGDRLFGTK